MFDESIHDLIVLLNQVGIHTSVSCSGLLIDHKENYYGSSTPYLCVARNRSNADRYKTFREIMIDSGFNPKEGSRKSSECFYFNFGHGITDPKISHDLEYEMLDEIEWQVKIRTAWMKVYRKVLECLCHSMPL